MKFQQRMFLRIGPWIGAAFCLLLISDAYMGSRRIEKSIENNLVNITEAIRTTIDTSTRIYQAHLAESVKVTEFLLGPDLRLSPTATETHTAQNQISLDVQQITLPAFEKKDHAGNWQRLEAGFAEEVSTLTGGTITIFQLFDEGLLRISTSVRHADGSPATGTFIPEESPVFKAITAGQSYTGRAFVVNDWYLTTYRPLYSGDQIIGAAYAGVSQHELDALSRTISEFRAGNSYYSAIVDIQGNIIIHPKWANRNVRDIHADGLIEAFAKIIHAAKAQKQEEGRIEYLLEGRKRINYYAYIPENEWIILSGVDARVLQDSVIRYLLIEALILGVIIAGIAFAIWSLSKSIARPVYELRRMVAKISRRNFDVELPKLEDDDTRKLGMAFQRMARNLQGFYHTLEEKVEERTRELEVAHREAIDAIKAKDLEIEQRQRAEDRLRESELQYRTLVGNLPGVIFRCQADPPYRLVFLSDSSHCLPELSAKDHCSLDQGFEAFALEEDRALVLTAFREAIEKRRPFHLEFRCLHNNLPYGWLSLRGSPVIGEGGINYIDCVAFDISEQKAHDEQLREMREQEAEQRGKLEMSSSVLHDIGNAVTNIGTTVSHLATDSRWPEMEQLKRLSQFLQAEGAQIEQALGQDRAAALGNFLKQLESSFGKRAEELHTSHLKLASTSQHITEILHLQRRYSNAAALHQRRAIRIHEVLNDSIAIFSGSLHKRKIELVRDFGAANCTVDGDQTRLLQVFNNLLKNSCDAIDSRLAEDPEAARSIRMVTTEEESWITIRIEDSGIGFPPETGPKLCERGFTTKPQGSGIGLDQCMQIIKSHGGQFKIESSGLSNGALVTLKFPLAPHPQSYAQAVEYKDPDHRRR